MTNGDVMTTQTDYAEALARSNADLRRLDLRTIATHGLVAIDIATRASIATPTMQTWSVVRSIFLGAQRHDDATLKTIAEYSRDLCSAGISRSRTFALDVWWSIGTLLEYLSPEWADMMDVARCGESNVKQLIMWERFGEVNFFKHSREELDALLSEYVATTLSALSQDERVALGWNDSPEGSECLKAEMAREGL